MNKIARVGDIISGTAHIEDNVPLSTVSPYISRIYSGSSNVFINGSPAAYVGCTTIEYDGMHVNSEGELVPQYGKTGPTGSQKVFINGIPACRMGDAISPHSGSAEITTGSPNVFIP